MARIRTTGNVAVACALTMMLAACGGGGGGGAGGSDGETISLRYAFFAPAQSFPGVQMEEWAKRLGEETNGQVEVELFPGGTLLASGDIFDGVTQGIVEVGMDSPAYDVERFPLSSVVTLPLGFRCSQAASKAMLDLLEEYRPQEFEDYEIITAFTTEPAYIQSKEPVRSMADLSGLELRTSGALTPALQLLGAAPVGMPMPDAAQALETGVIDGYASSREVLQDFGLADSVKYVTDYAFGVSNTFVAVMDKNYFESLPDNVKEAIRGLKAEMTEFASTYHDEQNVGAALEWATSEKGVEIVELDEGEAAQWDQRLQELIDSWLTEAAGNGFDPQEVLDRARELAQTYEGEC